MYSVYSIYYCVHNVHRYVLFPSPEEHFALSNEIRQPGPPRLCILAEPPAQPRGLKMRMATALGVPNNWIGRTYQVPESPLKVTLLLLSILKEC